MARCRVTAAATAGADRLCLPTVLGGRRNGPRRFIKEVREKLRMGSTDSTCSLCVGGSEMRFEAPAIYCNNPLCGVRIKRNALYYANENKRFQVGPTGVL